MHTIVVPQQETMHDRVTRESFIYPDTNRSRFQTKVLERAIENKSYDILKCDIIFMAAAIFVANVLVT